MTRFVAFLLLTATSSAAAPYDNVLSAVDLTVPYAEICWVRIAPLQPALAREVDVHPAGGPSSGGNCNPGDTGFVVEGVERPAAQWFEAQEDCLLDGMRLLEPFEFQLACEVAQGSGLLSFGDSFEWASNTPSVNRVSLMGTNACLGMSEGSVTTSTAPYHCAK